MKAFISLLFVFPFLHIYAQDTSTNARTEIIYGRKDGMALTMLKMSPAQNSKGKAIISIVSGNWVSGYNMIPSFTKQAGNFLSKGYTIFLVMHGSQPRYAITDEIEDVKRAVRFIRYNAKEYGIDSDHIGITGRSSGGHLSLMTALSDDKINTTARDEVDRVSSRVQAVAVFFPPTDFLNWGGMNTGIQQEMLVRARVAAAFDFKKLNDSTRTYERITNDETRKKIANDVSPISNVSSDDPPVLIAHGDADRIVPLQQSQSIIRKLKDSGVPNELIIKSGGSHGWNNSAEEEKKFIDWFDKYLK